MKLSESRYGEDLDDIDLEIGSTAQSGNASTRKTPKGSQVEISLAGLEALPHAAAEMGLKKERFTLKRLDSNASDGSFKAPSNITPTTAAGKAALAAVQTKIVNNSTGNFYNLDFSIVFQCFFDFFCNSREQNPSQTAAQVP